MIDRSPSVCAKTREVEPRHGQPEASREQKASTRAVPYLFSSRLAGLNMRSIIRTRAALSVVYGLWERMSSGGLSSARHLPQRWREACTASCPLDFQCPIARTQARLAPVALREGTHDRPLTSVHCPGVYVEKKTVVLLLRFATQCIARLPKHTIAMLTLVHNEHMLFQ